MQVDQHTHIRTTRPRRGFLPAPARAALPAAERPSFRPEPEGLSREELRKIIIDQMG